VAHEEMLGLDMSSDDRIGGHNIRWRNPELQMSTENRLGLTMLGFQYLGREKLGPEILGCIYFDPHVRRG
jgi:hypothetical protein